MSESAMELANERSSLNEQPGKLSCHIVYGDSATRDHARNKDSADLPLVKIQVAGVGLIHC